MANTVNAIPTLMLYWTPLIRISEFVHEGKEERGVYIWGFTVNRNFIPYYVGIADNIISRIHKHIRCILSGEYTIYHTNSLTNFKKFKDETARADKPEGKLYKPDLPNGFKNFLDNRKLLQPHIDFMIDTFTFQYAVVDREKTDQDLKEIEKICIGQIGMEKLANTRMGNSEKFSITHNGSILLTDSTTTTSC